MDWSNIMKILMVAPYFYPDTGGLENYVYNISKELVKRGHKITVICASKKENRKETIEGIKVIRQKADFILSNTPIKFSLPFKMVELLNKDKFDLINAHTPVPFYADVAAFISKKYNIPFILTYYFSPDLKKDFIFLDIITSLYQNLLEKSTLKKAKQIITVYEMKEKFNRYANKISVIPPGVNLSVFKPVIRYKKNKFNILFIGQLSKSHKFKGLDFLIDAFKHINNKNVYLTIVGSGDYLEHYKKKSMGYYNIIFKGKLDYKSLAKEYQKNDVLIIPSTTDGCPTVALEAMACGLPVIATNVGGLPYIIKNRHNGLLVPSRDPIALANAIIELMNDKWLINKLSKNGRKMVKDFTWGKNTEKYERIINQMELLQ